MNNNVLSVLKMYFGYDKFREPQDKIVNGLINGNNSLVIMPTGGGKSICYQLPAIVREGVTIVVSPLIALMQDQVNSLRANGINAAYINSSVSYKDKQAIMYQASIGQLKLLYVAPERLLEHHFYNWLKGINIGMFAIDEAHCVSQWGHDFRKEYLQLSCLVHDFPQVPRIALTATANELTRNEIINNLHLQQAEHYICGFDRSNITYHIQSKTDEQKQLLNYIKNNHTNETGIVYCLSRKKTEEIAKLLADNGFNALPYHARLDKETKEKNLDKFLKEDNIIIVATIAFGMGIDKPDVRFVCHVDLPSSIEAYYQETGRAGRDGEDSVAWMLYGVEDVVLRSKMVQEGNGNETYKRVEQNNLNSMFSLCEVATCRRQVLLNYFGDTLDKPCGNCDNCLAPPQVFDASVHAQKALSAVYRTGQLYGANYIIQVLLGNTNKKIEAKKHDELSVFGIGDNLSDGEWKNVFRQLIVLGYLNVEPVYGSLKLNEKARSVLQGKEKVKLKKSLLYTKRRRVTKSTDNIDFTLEDSQLFEELRSLRRNLAKGANVPPYAVFNDKSLKEMVLLKPRNLDDFKLVSGVGLAKSSKYGNDFIDTIEEFLSRDI